MLWTASEFCRSSIETASIAHVTMTGQATASDKLMRSVTSDQKFDSATC